MKAFAIACLCVIACSGPVWAKLSAADFEALLTGSKILPEGARVKTALRPGGELLITAYRQSSTTDCKVDAVLMAKSVFAADSDITHVTCLFFEIGNATDFLEVPVTVGDVAAFASGAISKEQLMSGIKSVVHSPSAASLTANAPPGAKVDSRNDKVIVKKEAAVSPTSSSQNADDTASEINKLFQSQAGGSVLGDVAKSILDPTSPTVVRKVPSGHATFSSSGLVIVHPAAWREESRAGELVRFFVPGVNTRKPTIIEVTMHSGSPATVLEQFKVVPIFEDAGLAQIATELGGQAAASFSQLFTGPGNYTRVVPASLPAAIKMGSRRDILAAQKAWYGLVGSTDQHKKYMRTVAFGSRGRTFVITMIAPNLDASVSSATFENLLGSVDYVDPARSGTSNATRPKRK